MASMLRENLAGDLEMDQDRMGVLFVCDDNSARSIIAEVLLNRFGEDRFHAYSAGLDPAAEVDPLALGILASSGLSVSGIRAKSWREFCSPQAPRIDFVISFCDTPACEIALGGDPVLACWHITDPRAASDEASRLLALRRAMRELENRVRLFVLLRHRKPEPTTNPRRHNTGEGQEHQVQQG